MRSELVVGSNGITDADGNVVNATVLGGDGVLVVPALDLSQLRGTAAGVTGSSAPYIQPTTPGEYPVGVRSRGGGTVFVTGPYAVFRPEVAGKKGFEDLEIVSVKPDAGIGAQVWRVFTFDKGEGVLPTERKTRFARARDGFSTVTSAPSSAVAPWNTGTHVQRLSQHAVGIRVYQATGAAMTINFYVWQRRVETLEASYVPYRDEDNVWSAGGVGSSTARVINGGWWTAQSASSVRIEWDEILELP